MKISHRTRGYYFRHRECVYDGGSYTFQSGSRNWPFSFTIPLEAENEDPRTQRPPHKRELDKIGIMKKNDIESLESDHFSSSPTWRGTYDSFRGRPDPHWLPDTFEYMSNRFPASCEARVEYELTATLKRPTRGVLFPAKDLEASHDVVLKSRYHLPRTSGKGRRRPDGTQIVHITQDFAAARLASINGAKTSALNRKVLSMFMTNDAPEVKVNISIFLDCYLRPGGLCPLLVQATQENTVNPPLGPIILRSYTLRLVARTALRGKQESVMVQDVNHYAVEGRVLVAAKGLDLDLPYSEGLAETDPEEVRRSLQEASPPILHKGWLNLSTKLPTYDADRQFMNPTFKTYNIDRGYEVSLEMKLECAGVKYDVKHEGIAVVLLAEEDHPANGRANPLLVSAEQVTTKSSKGVRELPDTGSSDQKSGPVPPPPRDVQPEPPPSYEPGDVPDYHAGDQ